MVKKALAWHEMDALTTPSQIRTYMDVCKDCILSIDDTESREDAEAEVSTQNLPAPFTPAHTDNLGCSRVEIVKVNHFRCFICEKDDIVANGKLESANPFTRAYCVLTCSSCALGPVT